MPRTAHVLTSLTVVLLIAVVGVCHVEGQQPFSGLCPCPPLLVVPDQLCVLFGQFFVSFLQRCVGSRQFFGGRLVALNLGDQLAVVDAQLVQVGAAPLGVHGHHIIERNVGVVFGVVDRDCPLRRHDGGGGRQQRALPFVLVLGWADDAPLNR